MVFLVRVGNQGKKVNSGVHLHNKVKLIRNHKVTGKLGSSIYQVKWSGDAESARSCG